MNRLSVISTIILLTTGQIALSNACFAQSQEDRVFYEQITGHKGNDESVLLLASVADEIEGNYSVTQKLKELQAYYSKHKAKNTAREAWVNSKLALYEFQNGSKEKANSYCNVALKSIYLPLAEPINLDAGIFYLEASEALANTLKSLNRTADFNRVCTRLSNAKLHFGRRSTERTLSDAVDYFIDGDIESAKARCADAIKSDPGYSGGYYLRAVFRLRDESYADAVKDLDRALLICPEFPHAYLLKSICLLNENKIDEAIATLDKGLTQTHDSLFYVIRGAARAEKGDLDACESDMNEAIKDPKVSWSAYAMRAECYMFHRQYDLAVKDYTRVVNEIDKKLTKTKARVYYRRGTAYLRLKDEAKANEDLKQCVALDPSRGEKVKKLTTKLDLADETKQTDKDEEGYAKIVSASDPEMPSFREGEAKVAKIASKKSRASIKSVQDPKGKPSWLIDAPASMDTGVAKSNTEANDKQAAGKSDTAASSASGDAAKNPRGSLSGSEAKTQTANDDPYIKYLEKQISGSVESAPSQTFRITFQIASDGAPSIQEVSGSKPSNMLSNTILRAGPFRSLPQGKSCLFQAEIQSGSTQVRISSVD